MKKIIILIVIATSILFIACNENESIKYEDKWIEITDTANVELRCLDCDVYREGRIIRTEEDYKSLWQMSVDTYPPNHPWGDCTQYISPDFDFDNRDLLGVCIVTGIANTYRKIFINHYLKECLFTLDIEVVSNALRGDAYSKWTSIPKIPENYKVTFDSTVTYKLFEI
jgi:hypothetical protein